MAKQKYYYSALDEEGEPISTGKNSSTEKECIEDVFDLMVMGMDDEGEDKPFEDFEYHEKRDYVRAVYDIEEHHDPYPDDLPDEDDDIQDLISEYGSNLTLRDDGGWYGGTRPIY